MPSITSPLTVSIDLSERKPDVFGLMYKCLKSAVELTDPVATTSNKFCVDDPRLPV